MVLHPRYSRLEHIALFLTNRSSWVPGLSEPRTVHLAPSSSFVGLALCYLEIYLPPVWTDSTPWLVVKTCFLEPLSLSLNLLLSDILWSRAVEGFWGETCVLRVCGKNYCFSLLFWLPLFFCLCSDISICYLANDPIRKLKGSPAWERPEDISFPLRPQKYPGTAVWVPRDRPLSGGCPQGKVHSPVSAWTLTTYTSCSLLTTTLPHLACV